MKFDPPADPYGNDHHCRICDTPMEYDDWAKTWYCPREHPERKDKKMEYTVSTLRAEWLEAEKDKIEAEISRMMDLRQYYQNMAELSHDDNDATEKWIRLANLVDHQIDQLQVKKDNLSLSVLASWMEDGTHPSPIISGGEVLDTNESKGGDDIPF